MIRFFKQLAESTCCSICQNGDGSGVELSNYIQFQKKGKGNPETVGIATDHQDRKQSIDNDKPIESESNAGDAIAELPIGENTTKECNSTKECNTTKECNATPGGATKLKNDCKNDTVSKEQSIETENVTDDTSLTSSHAKSEHAESAKHIPRSDDVNIDHQGDVTNEHGNDIKRGNVVNEHLGNIGKDNNNTNHAKSEHAESAKHIPTSDDVNIDHQGDATNLNEHGIDIKRGNVVNEHLGNIGKDKNNTNHAKSEHAESAKHIPTSDDVNIDHQGDATNEHAIDIKRGNVVNEHLGNIGKDKNNTKAEYTNNLMENNLEKTEEKVEDLNQKLDELKQKRAEEKVERQVIVQEELNIIEKLKAELQEKNEVIAKMKIFLDRSRHEKNNLNIKMQDLTVRLAKEMGTKVASDESCLENIDIKHRPMNIGSEYENLCSNQWHDAKTELDNSDSLNEEDRIKLLCDILIVSENESTTIYNSNMNKLEQLLMNPINENKVNSTSNRGINIPKDIQVRFGDIMRMHADINSFDSKIEVIQAELSKDNQSVKIHDLTKPMINQYINDCLCLTWKMVLQRPPMTFKMDGINEGWQGENKQEVFWNSSDPKHSDSKVKYYVHPALYHGETLMVKGKVFLQKTDKIKTKNND